MQEHSGIDGTLTQQDDHFRVLVESVRDYAIFHLDPQGYIRSWNEGARRIKGYDAPEIIGRHFSIFYPPHEARRGKPAYELAVATDEGRWEEEGWRLRKDGTRFWANVLITALYAPDGEVVGFAKVTRDLTERKFAEEQRNLALERERQARQAAEEALAEIQTLHYVTETALAHLSIDDVINELLERVQGFLEVDVLALLLLDPDGVTLKPSAMKGLDPAARGMLQATVGNGYAGRVAGERQPICVSDLALANDPDPILQELNIRSWLGVPLLADGRVTGVLHVGSIYHRNVGPKEERFLRIVADRIAMAIDRERLIWSEQEARIEAETADAKLRAQDAFLAVAAHELRSPTASVKTAVQLLMRRIRANPEGDRESWLSILETADQQTDRLTRLVDRLIESARIDSGQLGLELEHTDIVALVKATVELSRMLNGTHQITVSGPDELWGWVDQVRLEEVVSNLLENAIKHSESERIDVSLEQPDDEHWRMVIRDFGIGIPVEHRPHLFKRFYQGSDGTMERGLGLGLYICHEIVTGHAGQIEVDFPTNGGTRFTVTLPVQNP